MVDSGLVYLLERGTYNNDQKKVAKGACGLAGIIYYGNKCTVCQCC